MIEQLIWSIISGMTIAVFVLLFVLDRTEEK